MKKINEILGMTTQDYENMIFGAYSRWCENRAIKFEKTANTEINILDVKEWQLFLANSQLSNWFNAEFIKCENEFLSRIRRYDLSKLPLEDVRRCYSEATYQMFAIYPKSIIQEITKKKYVTDNTHAVGVKIQMLTFNQN